MGNEKLEVKKFWNSASCGEEMHLDKFDINGYDKQLKNRYELEPYILNFADFSNWENKDVLEIGVGLGADHQMFAEAGAKLTGIDLTERAIEHVKRRFDLLGLTSNLFVSDAENLEFPDNSFDLVYSYGVIHHSPDTALAANEIMRVLKPGGEFRIMVYYKWSLVGLMLWLRYGVFRMSLDEVYSRYLESPGTKVYTKNNINELFVGACDIKSQVMLTHGDLLSSGAGQRHKGFALTLARMIWPRWILRRIAGDYGLHLLVRGFKSADEGRTGG